MQITLDSTKHKLYFPG